MIIKHEFRFVTAQQHEIILKCPFKYYFRLHKNIKNLLYTCLKDLKNLNANNPRLN